MIAESFISLACAGIIACIFGLTLTFAGYRLFIFLLPIWGFFFGLALGAQSIQAIFGDAFLSTVTSWVVGFVVGAVFAVLSYLFWVAAVAVIAGSLGYALAVGILTGIGMDFGLVVWIVGIVAAIALAAVTIMLNLQKWVIIIATSVLGAGAVVGTFAVLFNPWTTAVANPIKTALNTSPLLAILFVVMAIAGIYSQYRSTRTFVVAEYSRWDTSAGSDLTA
jgi:hypothetical protein